MTDVSEPRTFHPYYVSSPGMRWIITFVIPALAFGMLVFVIGFIADLPKLIPADATDAEREAARSLLIALGVVLGTAPLPFFALWYFLRREYLQHTITIDSEGIVLRKGRLERRVNWCDIERVTTFNVGRVQLATVHSRRGKVRFDSSMVDRDGPQPRRKFSFKQQYLKYPDGTEQPLTILDNELYQLIKEHAPASSCDDHRRAG